MFERAEPGLARSVRALHGLAGVNCLDLPEPPFSLK